jgi:hypothetical protein
MNTTVTRKLMHILHRTNLKPASPAATLLDFGSIGIPLAVAALVVFMVALPSLAASPQNLGLQAMGARVASWERGVPIVIEHELDRANDGSLHTYWEVRPEDLPADLGLEWPQTQLLSSVVARYFDGKMVRGPATARTQQWARLQYWHGSGWKDIDAQLVGTETSTVRYVFPPVSTTRIRLLFTEPPDPEGRRSPGRLGIYVSELEAYKDVPFHWVGAPNRIARPPLTESHAYTRFYNEPPSGDNAYEPVGPLVIEPKQTRVFSDTLEPTLIVAESRWAKEACAMEKPSAGSFRLRNGFLQLDVSATGTLSETRLTNKVTGESAAVPDSTAFVIRTGAGILTPSSFKIAKSDTTGSDGNASRLTVDLTSDALDVTVHYELGKLDHFYHKWLTLKNKSGGITQVLDVTLSSLQLPHPVDLMAGQELTYPVTRMEKGGFFSAIEAVYWDHAGDALTYYPGAALDAGKSFETERTAIGVYKKRGEIMRGWDRGIREWITEYHARISSTSDEWPDVYCEGWSAKFGLQELVERPEWTVHIMETAQKMGIRYMDAYEAMHQVVGASPDLVSRFVALADRYQINTGWWTDFGSDTPWAGGEPFKPFSCLLSPQAGDYFRKLVELARTHHLRAMHWADFFATYPCSDTTHGHLPGKYSIYAQGQRMLKYGEELREASPGIMLGADGGFTSPQFVRYLDSRAHGTFYGGYTGDHFSATLPDLHIDRLYAEMNRVYAFGSYVGFLRPWFRMLNCPNHFGQESLKHDRAGFRYGLLSAIAMAGQVTFNSIPDNIPESETEFSRRWLKWARDNKDYLKQTDKLFNRSLHYGDIWQGDAEALSGFAHIRGDRGYVFLLNPSAVEQVADLALALDAPQTTNFGVEEVFPGGMTLQGPAGGLYPQGGKLRVTVPAKQVRIVWIAPAQATDPKRHAQPEDARVAETRRYVGNWSVVKSDADGATLRANFDFPANGGAYLINSASESEWSSEPWAHDKAYLVLLMKNEMEEVNNNWLPDRMLGLRADNRPVPPGSFTVLVNGVSRSVHEFKTKRHQPDKLTRCYFMNLTGETKAGQQNEVEVTLPIYKGLTFSGGYLDLPDQMPAGLP